MKKETWVYSEAHHAILWKMEETLQKKLDRHTDAFYVFFEPSEQELEQYDQGETPLFRLYFAYQDEEKAEKIEEGSEVYNHLLGLIEQKRTVTAMYTRFYQAVKKNSPGLFEEPFCIPVVPSIEIELILMAGIILIVIGLGRFLQGIKINL